MVSAGAFLDASNRTDKSFLLLAPQTLEAGLVRVDGKVIELSVAQSGGAAFDAAATEAAKKFEFEPAQVDGVKVAVRIQYRYEFTLAAPEPVPVKTTADFDGVYTIIPAVFVV